MLPELLIVIPPVLALWDYGRRRLNAQALRQDDLNAEIDNVLMQLGELKAKLDVHRQENDANAEYVRAVLSGFINSATDIISVSEEEKRQLRNRMTARALDPRRPA